MNTERVFKEFEENGVDKIDKMGSLKTTMERVRREFEKSGVSARESLREAKNDGLSYFLGGSMAEFINFLACHIQNKAILASYLKDKFTDPKFSLYYLHNCISENLGVRVADKEIETINGFALAMTAAFEEMDFFKIVNMKPETRYEMLNKLEDLCKNTVIYYLTKDSTALKMLYKKLDK